MKPIIPLHNGENGMKDHGESETTQNVSQYILSTLISTVNPLTKTTKGILSPTKRPHLVKPTQSQKKNQSDKTKSKVSDQFSQCEYSCLYPPDHIPDSRFKPYYPEYERGEKKKLNTFRSALQKELSLYNEFKNSLQRNNKSVAFSRYKTHIERIDKQPKSSVLRPSKERIVIKKFHGNKQVNTIYTKDNGNQLLSYSFIAKYPLSSDPYDVTCIFVMMFLLFYFIHS